VTRHGHQQVIASGRSLTSAQVVQQHDQHQQRVERPR
jgi:hypothetical protein